MFSNAEKDEQFQRRSYDTLCRNTCICSRILCLTKYLVSARLYFELPKNNLISVQLTSPVFFKILSRYVSMFLCACLWLTSAIKIYPLNSSSSSRLARSCHDFSVSKSTTQNPFFMTSSIYCFSCRSNLERT